MPDHTFVPTYVDVIQGQRVATCGTCGRPGVMRMTTERIMGLPTPRGWAHRHKGWELSPASAPPAQVEGQARRTARDVADGQDAMGIDWLPWSRLKEAIPPAYTEFIGRQLL